MEIYDPSRSLLSPDRSSSQTVECKTRPGPEEEARVGGGAERSRNPKWPGATAPGLLSCPLGSEGGVRGSGTTSLVLVARLGDPWLHELLDAQLLMGQPQRDTASERGWARHGLSGF